MLDQKPSKPTLTDSNTSSTLENGTARGFKDLPKVEDKVAVNSMHKAAQMRGDAEAIREAFEAGKCPYKTKLIRRRDNVF